MHICRTAVGMSHIAGEDHVLTVATNRGMRLCPVTLHAARTGMRQAIDLRSVHLRQHNLILVYLPIARGDRSIVVITREKLRSRRSGIKEGNSQPWLRRAAAIADVPIRLIVEQADSGGKVVQLPYVQSPATGAGITDSRQGHGIVHRLKNGMAIQIDSLVGWLGFNVRLLSPRAADPHTHSLSTSPPLASRLDV